MKLRWLLVVAGIAMVSFAGSCPGPDEEVRDWLTNYTQQEQAYFTWLEQWQELDNQRLCALEGVSPCPGSDPPGKPDVPTYP